VNLQEASLLADPRFNLPTTTQFALPVVPLFAAAWSVLTPPAGASTCRI